MQQLQHYSLLGVLRLSASPIYCFFFPTTCSHSVFIIPRSQINVVGCFRKLYAEHENLMFVRNIRHSITVPLGRFGLINVFLFIYSLVRENASPHLKMHCPHLNKGLILRVKFRRHDHVFCHAYFVT